MKIINRQNISDIINHIPTIKNAGKGAVVPGRKSNYRINHWTFMLFNYKGNIRLEDESFSIYPGCAFLTSPGVLKRHSPEEKSFHYYVHMDFQDYKIEAPFYLLFNLEEQYSSIAKSLNEILIYRQSDPLRAQIKMWDTLQSLKDCGGKHSKGVPLLLRKAVEYIETHIGTDIDIANLANVLCVSQSYLIRLFKRHYGTTIIGYIRKRRMDMAKLMLINSDIPIKNIGFEVGINDLQYFNKSVKKSFGLSPLKLRKQVQSIR